MKNNVKNVIKEMENEQRKKKVEPLIDQPVEFDIWWVSASKRLNLKSWMKEIIWAEFNSRGLSVKEMPAKYEDALKKFGF